MAKNLVIVESPAKAKTIEGYLGQDFIVKSSFGHVRDLPKNNHAIDIENGFRPTYIISDDKKRVVDELKKLAAQSQTIWLATDDDREGEAISWHLHEALQLDNKDVKRIVFREITKSAILKAIQQPRTIDYDLVNSQQARRILDRLVGFEISPVLWKKIKGGLSAGRVQSVAVRIIVEREREIEKFVPVSSFKIGALFDVEKGKTLYAEASQKVVDFVAAQDFLEKCMGANYFIHNLEVKPAKKSPAAPFTTSTLQQEASRKLSFSVAQTMTVAQKLYEAGKITYMRTDSTSLSQEAIGKAADTITKNYGEKYVQTRQYKTKSESAQEAHEAIRPTDFNTQVASQDRNEQRLYELIWKRAIASQMADAQLERTIATIKIDPVGYKRQTGQDPQMPFLVARGEVIKFDGFLKVYIESTDDEEDEDTKGMLPPLQIGQLLHLNQLTATESFTRHAPRYTEASLVKQLEEMGIGRPSTYAPIISTIQKRGYVVKEDRPGKERTYQILVLKNDVIQQKKASENVGAEKAKLFPTDMACLVNDFLVEYFAQIMDFSFTADVEKEFDAIAQGKQDWSKMIANFYKGFHQHVEESAGIERQQIARERVLGDDPVSGVPIKVIIGRFGAYVQIGEVSDDNPKPPRASLQKGQKFETIQLPEALQLFKLPRNAGNFEGKEMVVGISKFGPYVRHDGKYYSLTKEDDPYTLDESRAISLIEERRKADAAKLIKSFAENTEVQVLNGRYGPYIKVGKQNIKIPKDKKPEELTLEECLALAEEKGKTETTAAPKAKTVKPTAKTSTTKKTKSTTKETKAKKDAASAKPTNKKPKS
ncbi:MAG TPA: type I DNA topoisomerase [Microscillaceae bacterium]|jgi:DNA topoisomerase-1|nr:type I DNA topoisomerase [Microscillaceae bacterium]